MKKKILIIDDEEMICISLEEGLKDLGYQVETTLNGQEGLNKTKSFRPQIVFLDMRLPDVNGVELVKHIKDIDKEIEVIIMTAYGNIETAVKAMKNGAFDYINKPFDLEEIEIILTRIFKNLLISNKLLLLEKEQQNDEQYMIGKHASMEEIYNKINVLAHNDEVTVLIRGETGTGKELVASSIHQGSSRKKGPMLKINCGAIPKDLVESELFGFEKNAFTGATAKKKGLLEIADGGTVFLDEIGEVSIDIQTKLLRFLEERRFKRVGGLQDIEVDVRVVAATNKDLEEAVRNKEFREDLYYRLNVVPIDLPPLRERGQDILLLANYYLEQYNNKFNKKIKAFTHEVEEHFLQYSWKGNIRELKNVIERIVILHEEEYIHLYHLPVEIHNSNHYKKDISSTYERLEELLQGKFSLEDEVKKMEQYYIQKALIYSDGNYRKASELLGISRFALKRKMEKYST